MYYVPIRNVVGNGPCYFNEQLGVTICYPTSYVEYGFKSIFDMHYYNLVFVAIPAIGISIVLGILSLFKTKLNKYFFFSFLVLTAVALILTVLAFILDARIDFNIAVA